MESPPRLSPARGVLTDAPNRPASPPTPRKAKPLVGCSAETQEQALGGSGGRWSVDEKTEQASGKALVEG